MRAFSRRRRLVLVAGSAGLAITVAVLGLRHLRPGTPQMFLAPMIGVVEPCILAAQPPSGATSLERACTGPDGSAAALVDATLSALSPPGAASPKYELGYTLQVPLLKLFKPAGSDWAIDTQAVGRLVRTLRDSERPAILYLFSTHFSANAPIEEALQADPRNLSATQQGPLPREKYYGTDIFNWGFAASDNDVTRRRVQAVQAVLAEVCKLEPKQIARIKGVTLLGELHHLFPGFEGGMGFDGPYLVSDYSEASKRGFRAFLRNRYGAIDKLNVEVHGHWTAFDAVEPPSKALRSKDLRDFTEHIDSFAHGSLPISGWAYVKGSTEQSPPVVRVYRNGDLIGKTAATLGRQDVRQAVPGLGDANTGWRYDMDFRAVPAGLHRIDVFLEDGPDKLVHLATREITILDGNEAPRPLPQKALPPSRQADAQTKAHVDLPADKSTYRYNPLVPLWHAFRAQQVVDYLAYFANVVKASCLANTPVYTHQIVPFTNPSWDQNKYAIGASLRKLDGIRLGVSLYGEPTYGTSFMQWLATTTHARYGVTEFHPLKAMDAGQFRSMLAMHAARGADFVSFFLEPRWEGKLVPRPHNIFSFDPVNDRFGSAQLYKAVSGSPAGP